MQDKNGTKITVGDHVNITGSTDLWVIMTNQDDVGDVTIKQSDTNRVLWRHPQSLTAA